MSAGDINNYGVDELLLMGRDDLRELLKHVQERLADARKRVVFNWITAWLALGTVSFFVVVANGLFQRSSAVLVGVVLMGIVLPYGLYNRVASRYGPMISGYRNSITKIEFVMHQRGWL